MNYTPILKLKQGEYMALLDLNNEESKNLTPLIQIVHKFRFVENPDGTRTRFEIPHEKVLSDAINKIKQLSRFPKVYFDPRPLFEDNDDYILNEITNCSTLFGSNVIPVLTLSDLNTVQYGEQSLTFIKQQGICLRVFKNEVDILFFQKIDELLKKINIERKDTDIIFDYRVTDESCLKHFCNEMRQDKKINTWRSLTFVSGAFFESFIGLPPGTYHRKRTDFSLWKSIKEHLKDAREINYGDYAIQSPLYHIPDENSYPSRSLTYTREDEWEVFKGQNDQAKESAKTLQYYAHAKLLTDGGRLYGKACCKGDEKIIFISQNPKGRMGTFSTWVKVGTNHHISLTLRQLSNPS